MKKLILALTLLMSVTLSAQAMSYEQARRQALFLTDKMAYELNLTEEQYEAAYEINLDYLLSVDHRDDLYGIYWRQRNLDLSYVLFDWQFNSYMSAAYFYRPLYWDSGYWRFSIYARYPRRDYFYYGEPHFYTVYYGGHSWRTNGGRSWYKRHYSRPRVERDYYGMRDGYKRGDYRDGFNRNGRGHNGNAFGHQKQRDKEFRRVMKDNDNRSFGRQDNNRGYRESSTRTTVTTPDNRRGFGGSRTVRENLRSNDNRTFSNPSRSTEMRPGNSGNRSFGNSRPSESRSFSTPSRSTEIRSGSRSFGNNRPGDSAPGGNTNGNSNRRSFGNR